MIEIYLLGIVMILGAILAIWVQNLVSAIVSVGIVGFALTLSFLFLQAPDLAIVQVVVETLSLVILLAAVIKTTPEDTKEERKVARSAIYLGAAFFFATSLILFTRLVRFLPEFGHPNLRMASDYVLSGFEKTGAPNLVAAIILNLRGYDTLGEATVLFAAIVGMVSVLRKVGRKR